MAQLIRSLRSTERLTERSVGFPCLSVIFVCKLVFSKNSEPELRSSSIVGPFYSVQAFSSIPSNCEDQSAGVIVIVQCIRSPQNTEKVNVWKYVPVIRYRYRNLLVAEPLYCERQKTISNINKLSDNWKTIRFSLTSTTLGRLLRAAASIRARLMCNLSSEKVRLLFKCSF